MLPAKEKLDSAMEEPDFITNIYRIKLPEALECLSASFDWESLESQGAVKHLMEAMVQVRSKGYLFCVERREDDSEKLKHSKIQLCIFLPHGMKECKSPDSARAFLRTFGGRAYQEQVDECQITTQSLSLGGNSSKLPFHSLLATALKERVTDLLCRSLGMCRFGRWLVQRPSYELGGFWNRKANIAVHVKVVLPSGEPRNARLKVRLAKVNGFFLSSYLCCSNRSLMGCRAFLAPQAKPVVLGNFVGANSVGKLMLRKMKSAKSLVEVFSDDQSGFRAVLPVDSVLVPWTDYSQWEQKPSGSHLNNVIKRPLYPSEEPKAQNGQENLHSLETEMQYEEEYVDKDIEMMKDAGYSPKKTPTPPEKLRAYTPQVDTPGVEPEALGNLFSNDSYGADNESNRLRCVRELSNDDESLHNDDREFLTIFANNDLEIDLTMGATDGLESFAMGDDGRYSQEKATALEVSRKNSIDIRSNLRTIPAAPSIFESFSPIASRYGATEYEEDSLASFARYYPSKRRRSLQSRRKNERYKYTDRPYEWQQSTNEEFPNGNGEEVDNKKVRVDQSDGNCNLQRCSSWGVHQSTKKVFPELYVYDDANFELEVWNLQLSFQSDDCSADVVNWDWGSDSTLFTHSMAIPRPKELEQLRNMNCEGLRLFAMNCITRPQEKPSRIVCACERPTSLHWLLSVLPYQVLKDSAIVEPKDPLCVSWVAEGPVRIRDSKTDFKLVEPVPKSLVTIGYQGDWIDMSPGLLGLWEKGPLEPYISSKPMKVVFVVPKDLAEKARLFAKELKTLYHACRLGEWSPLIGDCVVHTIDLEDCDSRAEHDEMNVKSSDHAEEEKPEVSSSKDDKCSHLVYQGRITNYIRGIDSGDADSKQRLVWRSRHGISIDKSAESATAIFFVDRTVESCSCGKSIDTIASELLYNCASIICSSLSSWESKTIGWGAFSGTVKDSRCLPALVSLSLDEIQNPNGPLLKRLCFEAFVSSRRFTHGLLPPFHLPSDLNQTSRTCSPNPFTPSEEINQTSKVAIGTPSFEAVTTDCSSIASHEKDLPSFSANSPYIPMASPSGCAKGSLAKGDQTMTVSCDSTSLTALDVQDNITLHACPLIYDPLFVLSDKSSSSSSSSTQPPTLDLHCCYAIDKRIGFVSAVWTDSRGENLDIDIFQIPLVAGTSEIDWFALISRVFVGGSTLIGSAYLKSRDAVEEGVPYIRTSVTLTRMGGPLTRAESLEWESLVERNFNLARSVYERRQDKSDTSAVSNRAAPMTQAAKTGTPLGGSSIPTTPAYSPMPAMSPAFVFSSYTGSISSQLPQSPLPSANIATAFPEEEVYWMEFVQQIDIGTVEPDSSVFSLYQLTRGQPSTSDISVLTDSDELTYLVEDLSTFSDLISIGVCTCGKEHSRALAFKHNLSFRSNVRDKSKPVVEKSRDIKSTRKILRDLHALCCLGGLPSFERSWPAALPFHVGICSRTMRRLVDFATLA